jgi:predicted nuclease of restriction endonuclease-like (RecB) superfamily
MSKQKKPTTFTDDRFFSEIVEIIYSGRNIAYKAINSTLVETYWRIGKLIVEQEQSGKARDDYGEYLLRTLSELLTQKFGKGFDETNLRKIRQFYQVFPIRDALRLELNWTHYRHLMRVENDKTRLFYMNECAQAKWSTRQLERQINTRFYERLLSSQDKAGVSREIEQTAPAVAPKDHIKDPYVLEFLDITPSPNLYEKELETAIINHLQSFLLELGRGFSFVARQKHIFFDGRDFYIDLVFYHYILKCFILIDLKTDDLTHQDLGQMQMYVNYFTQEMMNEGDNPPIGIILCADKSDAIVKYTLPEDNSQIFASKYQLYLPSEEELRQEVREEMRRLEENK